MLVSRHCAAAQADPVDPLVVGEHAVGDRALVADLAEHELHLADSATAAPAAHPVPQPGPRQAAAGSRRRGPRRARRRARWSPPARVAARLETASIVLLSCAVHADRAEPVELGDHDPRPAAAARRPSGRRTARSIPASMHSPRAASASASQTSAAAGWPMTAPPAAVSITPAVPEHAAQHAESTSSSGGRPRAPSDDPRRAGVVGHRVRQAEAARSSASPRPRWPGTTASVAASTWATVVGASIRFPIRNAISGSARGG